MDITIIIITIIIPNHTVKHILYFRTCKGRIQYQVSKQKKVTLCLK